MRFLIISKTMHMVPPEMGPGLVDAFSAYIAKYTESGKVEQSWSFAGLNAGCAILNVASLDELDAILQEYPLGPFSELEVHGLVDLQQSIQRTKEIMQAMAAGMG
jgi:muconolactone delta-isomerase